MIETREFAEHVFHFGGVIATANTTDRLFTAIIIPPIRRSSRACGTRYFLTVYSGNKKGQLSLTNPRDACETFARFMHVRAVGCKLYS